MRMRERVTEREETERMRESERRTRVDRENESVWWR
jgi:hypothetical protein